MAEHPISFSSLTHSLQVDGSRVGTTLQVCTGLAVLVLQVLARDVQLVRRAVDQLLLHHASVLARLLRRRVVILQLLSR